jgi:protein-S-isoprenylcysteine O-methyltransferase Ste14
VRTFFRWSGALVFLVSLLSFAFIYSIRLRTPAPEEGTTVRDAITNIALFTIFAMHHSVMARSGAKAWIARQLPPNLERSVYVWIASLLFLAACWLWRPMPGVVWQLGGFGAALYLVQLAGVVLTVAAARLVGVWELAGVKQPDPDRPVEFSATGPFSLVRHPIYLGWILIVFATPLMTSAQLLFAVTSTLYLVAAIPFEERSILESHGEAYRAYQKQMRWKLIPYIW